jgi:hypothetical protein
MMFQDGIEGRKLKGLPGLSRPRTFLLLLIKEISMLLLLLML